MRLFKSMLVGMFIMIASFCPVQVDGRPSHGGGGGGIRKMGRLRTMGGEIGLGSDGLEGIITGGTVTSDPSLPRSGAASYKCVGGAASIAAFQIVLTSAELPIVPGDLFYRAYFQFINLPANLTTIIDVGSGNERVRLTAAGKLQIWDGAAQVGVDSNVTIVTGQWYRIEFNIHQIVAGASDSLELRVNGSTECSATGLSIADFSLLGLLKLGWTEFPGATVTLYVDDIAINSGVGAVQNSWPGDGSEVFLKPISDNAVGTGWVDGDGAGTLFGSVDNAPPAGAVTPADGTQIKNLTSTTTGNYDTNVTDYATAGVPAGATITLVQAVCDHAEAIATGTKLGALQIVSNPAQAVEDGFTYGNDVGAMGAWPTNWRAAWGTAQYAPVVTLGTSPVLRVGKRTATTREVDVDCMGIYVEYVPATVSMSPLGEVYGPL